MSQVSSKLKLPIFANNRSGSNQLASGELVANSRSRIQTERATFKLEVPIAKPAIRSLSTDSADISADIDRK